MNITKLGVLELARAIKAQQITAQVAVEQFIEAIKQNTHKNAVLEVFEDAVLEAKKIDENIKNKTETRPLAGVPIIIKDNMLLKGHKATCASKFLEHFVSPYTATAVKKLLDNGAIILGRANMDEFAMGGSNENSAYGICYNALSANHVAGGSSGGSAASVAANFCAAALGTDTGGSVRQPSSFNGVVGMKPTYGRISRYGIVAFASSLDQVGPVTKNVEDNALLLTLLAGQDENDQTSRKEPVEDYSSYINKNIEGVTIGLCEELVALVKNTKYYDKFLNVIAFLEQNGAKIHRFHVKDVTLALPVYYIISTAEAASNLGRFDGVKYTTRSKSAHDIKQVYVKSRTEGFGAEVKRRIMLGNYVLSSGYYDAYYVKAKKLQTKIAHDFKQAFEQCDVMLLPTTYGEAFEVGEKLKNPVSMYLEDMFTVLANIAGIPAISIPYSTGKAGLPLGLQVISKPFNEGTIYQVAHFIEINYKEKAL